MADGQLHAVIRHLRSIGDTRETGGLTDAQLLERFVTARDEAAFEVLLWRHGPMVINLCRRLLRHDHDVEDAFQAAFLVLVRKASSIGRRRSVGSWLYKVAYRVALEAKACAAKRAAQEKPMVDLPAPASTDDLVWRDLRPVLDEEVSRLPEKYRGPFVLCYLEGKTKEEAAQELGCPKGTISSRLAWARERLRTRLVRRGVALSAGMLSSYAVSAAVPSMLVAATIRGMKEAALATRAAALAEGVLRAMFLTKLKTAAVLLLAVGALVMGAGIAAHQALTAKQPVTQQEAPQKPLSPSAEQLPPADVKEPRIDLYGDPLPPGALARMGTARLRHAGGNLGVLTFSPTGGSLVSANQDGIVHVWDPKTGKELRQVKTFPDPVADITLSADLQLVAAASLTNRIGLWEFASGKALREIELPQPMPVVRLAFTPDAKLLAWTSAGKDAEILFWETATGQLLRRVRPQPNLTSITRLAFTADGGTLLAKTSDGVVHFLDPTSGKASHRFRSNENTSPSYALAPDGRMFAFGENSSVVLWDLANGKELARLATPRSRGPTIGGVTFSPDGKTLASAGFFSVHLWDVANRKELHTIDGLGLRSAYRLCFSPDGKTLAAAGSSTAIRLWDVATGQELHRREGHSGGVYETAFSPDGRLLATRGGDETLRLWESATGKLVHTIPGDRPSFLCMLFSPDGKTLLAGDWSSTVRCFDTGSGKELRRFSVPKEPGKEQENEVSRLALSGDGKQLTALVRRTLSDPQGRQAPSILTLAWDMDTGKQIFQHEQPGIPSSVWALSPDGRLRASYNHGPVSNLRDVRTGKQLLAVAGKCEGIFPVVFSPDGRSLAGVCHRGRGRPKTVTLWELATGGEIRRFSTAFLGLRVSLAFSGDGSILAAAGDDAAGLRLWDLTTGKELFRYEGAGAAIASLTFSGDSQRLAGGLVNGTALVWDAGPALRQSGGRGTDLSAEDLERLWTVLGKEEAATGQTALWSLAIRPKQAIPFLKGRLRPAAEADPRRIRQILTDLDSDQFSVREAAAKELEQQDQQAEALLRQALAEKPSPEVRKRVEAFLAGPRLARSPETLRRLRSIQALEYMGSSEAQDLLKLLATGTSVAWETQEAQASLERLAKRPRTNP